MEREVITPMSDMSCSHTLGTNDITWKALLENRLLSVSDSGNLG